MKGKPKERALLRSGVVKLEQTTSTRRLQRDLKELDEQTVPLVGISARPLSNSMFIWHGNLRGPKGSIYEGGVFHFEMTFPANYPMGPPTLKLFTPMPHPNVFTQTAICLDILDIKQKQIYQGWTTAYTVETILIQLQSFLLEDLPATDNYSKAKGQEAVKVANAYKCTHPDCNHQGPLKPYPPFNSKEKDMSAFLMVRTPDEIKQDDLVCFHTKNKLKEGTLGIGVSITRLPRTGEIRMITSTLDLLSIRAFIKHKVRHSLANEKFTHWLPIYFGEKEVIETKRNVFDKATQKFVQEAVTINCKERFVHLLKKSLALVCAGSTRRAFTHKMVLEVIPKLMVTHVLDMIQQQKHISILALRRLVNFIRLFGLFIELYPELQQEINEKVKEFIEQPDKRVKDHCPSLGDLLAYVSVTDKYKIEDVLSAYLEEQLDRQAFWILREIPELDHEDEKYKGKEVIMEEARSEACFKTTIVGYHLTLFFYSLNKMIMQNADGSPKQLSQLCNYLDDHYGCLNEKDEDEFQKHCQKILEVNNFIKYYTMMNINVPNDDALRERLRQSISNSRKKGYHGAEGSINEIPKINEQALALLSQKSTPWTFHSESGFLPPEDPNWQKATLEKFSWIESHFANSAAGEELKPYEFALMSDEDAILKRDIKNVKFNKDRLRNKITSDLYTPEILKIQKASVSSDYDPATFSWRDLYLKLSFEQMIDLFAEHQDFKLFYKYINDVGPHIQCLRVKILDKTHFKSNHYWLMALIGRLTKLKVLKIHKDVITAFGNDGFKFFFKGLKYFQESGGSLMKIDMSNLLGSYSAEYFNQCLKCIPELRILNFSNNQLSLKDAQNIGKILYEFKFIEEVDLTNTNLDHAKAKEIADGLMKAKLLQIFKAGKNPNIKKGADVILYNLAFSPRITHVDFSEDPIATAETAEALYKLLKISGSLETLILSKTNINSQLQEPFFIAIGESKSIQYLNLDMHPLNASQINLLGRACAMNNKKGDTLKYLSIQNCIQNQAQFVSFLDSMKISDYMHEMWYGEQKIAREMQKEQLETKFHFGLKHINFGNCKLSGNNFRLKEFLKRKNPTWPVIFNLFSSGIEILSMKGSGIGRNDMELFSNCIYNEIENYPFPQTKLKVLNLSRNNITKEGSKVLAASLGKNASLEVLDLSQCKLGVSGTVAIANALLSNNTLKSLNLYRNIVDVDGARSLRELLKVNKKLEFLDLGYNRLRENGLKAITDGICANPDSQIKHLGIRFNFINDDGFNYLFQNAIFKGKSKITHVYAIQNYITEHFTLELHKQVQQSGKKIFVDQFEKVQYLSQERLDRSIWISPLEGNLIQNVEKIKKFFQKDFECGLISDIRVRQGQKIPGKPKDNYYAVIEYTHQNSLPRSLRVASKKKSVLDRVRFRIYKAGTRTIVFVRPQKKKSNQSKGWSEA